MVHTETKKKLRIYLKFKLNWASFILSHRLSPFPSVSLGVRKVRNVGKVQEKQTNQISREDHKTAQKQPKQDKMFEDYFFFLGNFNINIPGLSFNFKYL